MCTCVSVFVFERAPSLIPVAAQVLVKPYVPDTDSNGRPDAVVRGSATPQRRPA